jgi:hypothetical protein
MNWIKLVAVTGVAVLVSLSGAQAASLQASPEILPACDNVATPPAFLATQSKYDQSDRSRSTLSLSAAEGRETVLQPIRAAVRGLYAGVERTGGYDCALRSLAGWAAANALGDMQTEDAFLSRDRLVSEMVMLLVEADRNGGMADADRIAIAGWLRAIAASTVEFYDYRAGRVSRVNNHRYWAGLAVGSIGYLLGDDELVFWATQSYRIGVCQVDADGYLPLELARGPQALNYHVYAMRPLLAFAALAQGNGDDVAGLCDNGLDRLAAATRAALANPDGFSRLVGVRQDRLPRETNYPKQLRLAAFGF